jgi:hypothetical protein
MSQQSVVSEHGASGYRKGCRCRECRAGVAAECADWRLRSGRTKQRKWAGDVRPVAKHGTRSKYVSGCRCDDCADANRVYKRNVG